MAPYSHSTDLPVLLPLLAKIAGAESMVAQEWGVLGVLACVVVPAGFLLWANLAATNGRLSVASTAVAAGVAVAYLRSPFG